MDPSQSGGERGHVGEPGPGDPDGGNEFANRRRKAFTGAGTNSQPARFEAIHTQDRDRTLALPQRSIATGEPFEADFRLRRRDGAYRWQLARAAPQRDAQSAILRWIGPATDIEAQFRAVHESAIDGFMVLRSARDAAGHIVDFFWRYANEARAAWSASRAPGSPTAGCSRPFPATEGPTCLSADAPSSRCGGCRSGRPSCSRSATACAR